MSLKQTLSIIVGAAQAPDPHTAGISSPIGIQSFNFWRLWCNFAGQRLTHRPTNHSWTHRVSLYESSASITLSWWPGCFFQRLGMALLPRERQRLWLLAIVAIPKRLSFFTSPCFVAKLSDSCSRWQTIARHFRYACIPTWWFYIYHLPACKPSNHPCLHTSPNSLDRNVMTKGQRGDIYHWDRSKPNKTPPKLADLKGSLKQIIAAHMQHIMALILITMIVIVIIWITIIITVCCKRPSPPSCQTQRPQFQRVTNGLSIQVLVHSCIFSSATTTLTGTPGRWLSSSPNR